MDKQRSNAFMLKVVADVATTLAATLLIVGDRTGLFKAMAGAGPLSGAELAERAGIAPRYADEWLAAMAGAGYVEYDPSSSRFTLPDEHALFLTDQASEYYLGGLFGGLPTMANMIPRIAEAFRSGGGIAFGDFGAELPMALAAMNRSVYENRLVKSWLPSLPGVVEKLQPGGRAVDIGCGVGVVPIALARAFPHATVAGLDFDARSIGTFVAPRWRSTRCARAERRCCRRSVRRRFAPRRACRDLRNAPPLAGSRLVQVSKSCS